MKVVLPLLVAVLTASAVYNVCAMKTEGEECGGDNLELGSCAEGLVCSNDGKCVCEKLGNVCGSDGKDYTSACALNSASQKLLESGREGLEVAYEGYCKRAPKITIPPKYINELEGTRALFICKGNGVPIPRVRWYSSDGEELPGENLKANIQARSGPNRHESSGWLVIDGIDQSDAGDYICKLINSEGEASEIGNLVVRPTITKKTEL
ncbi:insulin-like growth factor-binding protein-like 1 [Glandiceps talaboti]